MGVEIDANGARDTVYGIPYSEWKAEHQRPATDEQMAAFEARQKN